METENSKPTVQPNSPQRKIIHIDMDCFYAAVEMLDRPDLKDRPMAVGGRPEGRGVITTANYKAREFGVHSALPCREAVKRCPKLVILPIRFQKYREMSRLIRQIFSRYTDLIEPLSLDEAYLDVSGTSHFQGNATATAQAIRKDIYQELGLTASAGISNSKFLAKIASDWNKPNGQLTIQPKDIDSFIKTLPVKKIPGVGTATVKRMDKLELKTCEDLQKLTMEEITHHFGQFGARLYDLCRGIDHSTVKPNRNRKSISVETTFAKDLSDWLEIKKEVEKLFEELEFRVKKSNLTNENFKTLAVKLKNIKFQTTTREKALPFSKENFLKIAEDHFFSLGEPIRLLGLGCKIDVKEPKKSRNQLNLF